MWLEFKPLFEVAIGEEVAGFLVVQGGRSQQRRNSSLGEGAQERGETGLLNRIVSPGVGRSFPARYREDRRDQKLPILYFEAASHFQISPFAQKRPFDPPYFEFLQTCRGKRLPFISFLALFTKRTRKFLHTPLGCFICLLILRIDLEE